MYQNFIIPYLYEAQHVSGDTTPIIRGLKLHWQPLVVHRWKVVGRVVAGRCRLTTSTNYTSNNLPRYYEKPEAGSAVLGSWRRAVCRPKHVELHINVWNKNFDTLLHLVGFFSMNCSLLSSLQPATCPSTEPHQSVVILSSHLQLGLPSDRFP